MENHKDGFISLKKIMKSFPKFDKCPIHFITAFL